MQFELKINEQGEYHLKYEGKMHEISACLHGIMSNDINFCNMVILALSPILDEHYGREDLRLELYTLMLMAGTIQTYDEQTSNKQTP